MFVKGVWFATVLKVSFFLIRFCQPGDPSLDTASLQELQQSSFTEAVRSNSTHQQGHNCFSVQRTDICVAIHLKAVFLHNLPVVIKIIFRMQFCKFIQSRLEFPHSGIVMNCRDVVNTILF